MNVSHCRLAAGLAALLAAAPFPAGALTYTVASRNDSGPGSLRQAILDANAAPGQDTIQITALGQIALRSPLPTLAGNTIINGPGTNRLVVSAGGTNRILATAEGTTNFLRELTLANGWTSAGAHGGAISNAGVLTLQDVVITNCHAIGAFGGAIYNHSGAMVEGVLTLFIGNSARGGDGQSRGPGQSGGGGGGGAGLGGAVFSAGEFHFSSCEFNCNTARGGHGGAGGDDGTNYSGGQGGGPNSGLGGAEDFAGATAAGMGGGGGGGGGTDFGTQDHGGAGGFGGGGGGAGARRFDGSGGVGGAGGRFGGRGGASCCLRAGGGGGGAGLGGAIFASSGVQGTLLACHFVRNLAWNGSGGTGAPGTGEGADAVGAGGAVFSESPTGLILDPVPGNVFAGNAASTAFPDVTAGALMVTSLADAGPGSLRQTLADAAGAAVPPTILVEVTNVISLAAPLQWMAGAALVIGGGSGPEGLVLSGSNAVRVVEVGPAASLALRGLTIADGLSTNGGGAGVRNAGGSLRLDDCVVRNNHGVGAVGGGVFSSGSFHATRTSFRGNSARGLNGASRLFGTSGGGGGGGAGLGGGIFSAGPMHLERCLVSSNSVSGGNGGTGGESGLDYAGGAGGDPEGGIAGSGYRLPGSPGGFGGGGGGGGGGEDPELFQGADGGAGGFGGGGGGGGASSSGGDAEGIGGDGGAGVFGGAGAGGTNHFAGGGGGGAGLGGGIFVQNGVALLTACTITGNAATNGVAGVGGAGFFPNGTPYPATNGAGVAGGLFDLARSVALLDTTVTGNVASSSNANTFTAPAYSASLDDFQDFVINPGVGTNATFVARTTGPGPFNYQWFFNGQLIGTGQTLVISNVSITNIGVYHLVVTTPTGASYSFAAPLGVRYSGGPDQTRPTLAITAPTPLSLRVATTPIQFAGTARDASGIAGIVAVRSDVGGETLLATGTTNWTLTVPLRAGTNVLAVSAFDRAGNESTRQRRTVYYAVTNRLKLAVSGQGIVLPNLHNQPLEVGRGYTLRATPGAGYIFSNWLGGAFPDGLPLSETGALSFLMTSNLTLQANFVPNPFPARAGAYNGLFAESDEARVERSGAFNATVTPLGTFTAALRTAGRRHAFSGRFNAGGLATNRVLRPGATALTVGLQLHLNGDNRITGSVTDGNWSADLWADRAAFHATTNRATNFLGNYTLAILTGGGLTEAVGSATVSAGGLAKFSGSLFDTPALVQQAPLSRDGVWPFFAPLYGGRGQLLARLHVGSFGQDSLTGRVAWVKPALPATLAASRLTPKTFTNTLSAVGSSYSNPGTNRVLNFTQGVAEFDGGDLGAAFTNAIALSAGNVVANLSPNALSLVIAKPTGRFSGKVTAPGTNRMAVFKGAVLQQRGYGTGFFAGTNGVGQVYFGPVTP